MATNIKTLLNKKTWKGEDVGRALILNLINDVRHIEDPDHDPLFSQSELDRMQNNLRDKTTHDITVYNRYISLYNGLAGEYDRMEAVIQQAHNGLNVLLRHVALLMQAEDTEELLEKVPIIMTEKQYKSTVEKIEAKKRAFTENYSGLIFTVLSYYLGEYSGVKPTVPKPIRDALDALKKEPLTNERVLNLINESYGLGYYQLPDGRRSDQLTNDEWQNILKEEFLKTHILKVNGEIQDYEKTIENFSLENRLNYYKQIYDGEISENERYEDNATNYIKTTWHTYKDAPEDLNKWDVIAGDYNMVEHYSGIIAETELERIECFKDFIKEFPDLYNALKEDISKNKDLKKFTGIKPEKSVEPITSWGELADAEAYIYPKLIKSNDKVDLLEEYNNSGKYSQRGIYSGISILKEGTLLKSQIDENGHYIESFNPFNKLLTSIEVIKNNEEDKIQIKTAREKSLLPALKELKAYNSLLDLLAIHFKLPEIKDMKKNLNPISSQIEDGLNGLVLTLFNSVVGTDEKKKHKREIIKEIFPLIDLENLNPDPNAITELKEKLQENIQPDYSQLHILVLFLTGYGEGAE